MDHPTTLGVTVNAEFVQVEGVDAVLANVAGRLKARTVTTVPAVMEPTDDDGGGREPPLDAGLGKDRLLDRALWGRRWLYVKSGPSFEPNRDLYTGLAFQPPEPDALTDREGPKVAAFLAGLKQQGIETQLQIMAAAPPCYRVQSIGKITDADPLTPIGETVPNRVDANLSLAHPELRAYLSALIADLVANYPEMDVLRFDWAEYPPYHPDSLAFDFSEHAMRLGGALGHDGLGLKGRLAGFGPELKALLAADASTQPLDSVDLKAHAPVLAELLDYRRALVVNYAEFLAREVRQASNGRVRCFLQCFPPPFNLLSGFDIAAIDPLVSDIGIKLYTMHWPMIERAYVERLIAFAGGDADHRLRQVRSLLRTAPTEQGAFTEVAYPRPDESHPAPDDLLEEKLRTAAAGISHARMWGLTHSYGPVDDVVRRFRAVHRAAGGRIHINRYGYLSDEKIAAIEAVI